MSVYKSYYITLFSNRVHIITWNVGSATPPDDITSLLGLNVGDGNTDMYIIGWVWCSCHRLHIIVLYFFFSSWKMITKVDSYLKHNEVSTHGYYFLYLSSHCYITKSSTYQLLFYTYLLLNPLNVVTVCHFPLRLQEVNSMINKRLKDVLFTDQWSEVCMERLSPFGYVLVSNCIYC